LARLQLGQENMTVSNEQVVERHVINVGIPDENELNTKTFSQPLPPRRDSATLPNNEALVCPVCYHPLQGGEDSCPACKVLLRNLPLSNQTLNKFVAQPDIIYLEIDSYLLSIPIESAIVLGRGTLPLPDNIPLIDLTEYKAWAYGISRQHLGIVKRDGLYYVMDLGSSNGTRLNQVLLPPYEEHVLNDGDELSLSQMKVIVSFV
jgi:hypothetical protein